MMYFSVVLEQNDTILELLTKGFSVFGGRFKSTYRDKELTILECNIANRSFLALLEICQTYFPATTENDLKIALNILCTKNDLYTLFCTDINEWVFFKAVCDLDRCKERLKQNNIEYRNDLEAIGLYRRLNDPMSSYSNPIDYCGQSGISLEYVCTVNEELQLKLNLQNEVQTSI